MATNEIVDKAESLVVEIRITVDRMVRDYRRNNIVQLRRAKKMAALCARLAAHLASTAFEAADLLDAELWMLRNKRDE